MISKDKFIHYMTELKKIEDIGDEIHKALRLLSSSNDFFLEKPFNIMLNMLEDLTHDEYGNISYFICELEWGKKAEDDSVSDADGTPIPMKTIEDLYNKLVKDEEYRCKKSY